MPKHNFMISKAVDLVARKLAGMDSETIGRLTQVLSEEAQMISEELQHSGQNVNSDILAARLEGLVTRMKYEFRNQGPDPSPHEFPIFNVSHNPTAPYPNPINHLYDKRYKEAYSTFIKQNQEAAATSQKNEPSKPTTPSVPKPPVTPSSTSRNSYPQGQLPQQSNQPFGFRQGPNGGGQFSNPYATMPRSQAAYYQQQAGKIMPPILEQPLVVSGGQNLRRSSTNDDLRPNPLSRSASSDDLNYGINPGAEKIRVRVVNHNTSSGSVDPQMNSGSRGRISSQRSILKPNNELDDGSALIATRRIYAAPETELGPETMQDLFKVVNQQRSGSSRSGASPMTERVIIIDRRGSNTPDDTANTTGKDRFRTFEIRTAVPPATPTTPPSPAPVATVTPGTSTPPVAYAVRQPVYYPAQQLQYQQPKMYSSVPNNLYASANPFVAGGNAFYPFTYYPY